MTDRQLLEAAREGDQDAFGRLVGGHRAALYVHCYRMLGSPQDAEDALQEALLRAWRGLPRFDGRASLRSWLYTIATNASLRALERRPRRVLPIDDWPPSEPHERRGEPLTETAWLMPVPEAALAGAATSPAPPDARYEQRESVELAFVAALQLLPARQRAVLILRDVLGFSGEEVARAMDTTTTAVYSALQRAHKTVDARLPARSQQATLSALGDAGLRAVVDGYVDAWERADVDALAAMLVEDATFSMPPHSTWYQGRAAVTGFLGQGPLGPGRRWRTVPTRANGQLAFTHHQLDGGAATPYGVSVVTLRDARIEAITAFLMPELVGRFAPGA